MSGLRRKLRNDLLKNKIKIWRGVGENEAEVE